MQESRLPRGLLKRLEETKEEESDTKERLETRLAAAEKRRQAALLTRQAKAKQLTSLHIMHGLRDCKPSEPCLACTPDNLCFLHQPKMPASHTRAGFAYSLNVYDEIQEILPRMYLGNYWAAGRRDIMRNYAISHVLTVGNGIDPPEMGLIRKQLSVEDCRGENLLNHMCEAIRFIDEGRGLVPSSDPSSSAPAAPPPPPSASPPSSPVSMFVSSSVTSNNADISVEILEGSKSFPHEDLSPAPHSCTSVNLENHVSTEQQPTNACNIEIAPSPAGPSSSAFCSSAKYPPAINPSNNPLPASSPTSVSAASSPTAGSPASAASSPASVSVSVTSASPASVSTASSPASVSAASSPASPSPASSPASVSATSSPAPASAAGSPRPSPANPAPSEPPDRTLPAVFIHCAAGVSRSATVCIAYCMLRQKMTYEQAHAHVLKCRPVIRPNIGFVSQLKMLEETDGDIERAARSWRQWRDSDEDF